MQGHNDCEEFTDLQVGNCNDGRHNHQRRRHDRKFIARSNFSTLRGDDELVWFNYRHNHRHSQVKLETSDELSPQRRGAVDSWSQVMSRFNRRTVFTERRGVEAKLT